jgi:hypothetical protein
VPRVLVTDKLASYGVAHRRLIRGVEHRQSKYLNNRAENSHELLSAEILTAGWRIYCPWRLCGWASSQRSLGGGCCVMEGF